MTNPAPNDLMQVIEGLEPHLRLERADLTFDQLKELVGSPDELIPELLRVYSPDPALPPPCDETKATIKVLFWNHLELVDDIKIMIEENSAPEDSKKFIGDPDELEKKKTNEAVIALGLLRLEEGGGSSARAGVLNNLACACAWLFDFNNAKRFVGEAITTGNQDPEGAKEKAEKNQDHIEKALDLWEKSGC